jgi:hypothetical protein
MSGMLVLNGLLGAICGLRFSAKVLIPLIAIVFVEVMMLKQTETWLRAVWQGVALIVALEVCYFIGASVATFWPSFREGVLRHFKKHEGRVTHRW